jgi:hypothetical protein
LVGKSKRVPDGNHPGAKGLDRIGKVVVNHEAKRRVQWIALQMAALDTLCRCARFVKRRVLTADDADGTDKIKFIRVIREIRG